MNITSINKYLSSLDQDIKSEISNNKKSDKNELLNFNKHSKKKSFEINELKVY